MKTGTQHRRRALAIALSTAYALGPQWAFANPQDARVIAGQATIQSQGNQLTVSEPSKSVRRRLMRWERAPSSTPGS